ncbi:MAG: 7-carboxy-7-deazaguanine synthase QueE [Gammaproteobacteria bacterium]|nr:7-carboxy-7-deazaguanine synthase QueE [Gammaproteobacteria bacterium]
MQNKIRITEIFHSIQGESLTAGVPTVFIRLTGCPLRCQYCDTTYAFRGGKHKSIPDILSDISSYGTAYVCVTGGEPLAQPLCFELLTALCDAGFKVSLETSGALAIDGVDPRVMIVMDLKTPDSLEADKNKLSNLDVIKSTDQIKFVICSRADYDWAVDIVRTQALSDKTTVLFSPSWEQLKPTTLAEWILEDKVPVRLQLQLHKILWHDEPGR